MTNTEIDRLVAEKVMGWKVYDDLSQATRGTYGIDTDGRVWHHAGFVVFEPSTSISDAWAVVEMFQVGAVEIARGFDCWSCEFTGPKGNGKALAKTIELAISLAALKALNVEVPDGQR